MTCRVCGRDTDDVGTCRCLYEERPYVPEVTIECVECGRRTRHYEDNRCPRCNGVDVDAEVRAANLAAWNKFRSERPEFFK